MANPVSVLGPQRLLVVAVRFPGTAPTQTLDQSVAVAPLSSETDATVRLIVTTPERLGDFVRD
jgi:hypothetical protein